MRRRNPIKAEIARNLTAHQLRACSGAIAFGSIWTWGLIKHKSAFNPRLETKEARRKGYVVS